MSLRCYALYHEMLTLLNKTGSMKVSMENLRQGTYKGVNLSNVEQDLIKLEKEIAWFGEHHSMEHLEALTATLRDRYNNLLLLEDDGSLPFVVTSLISALQQCDDMRR